MMADKSFHDYLWDRSGEPDELVRSLESLLARYRFENPPPPAFEGVELEADGDSTG